MKVVYVPSGVEVEGEGPACCREVGLHVLDLAQLPDVTTGLQRGGLAAAEEVVLIQSWGGQDELLDGREAGADLEGAGGALFHLVRDDQAVRGLAPSPSPGTYPRARSSRER